MVFCAPPTVMGAAAPHPASVLGLQPYSQGLRKTLLSEDGAVQQARNRGSPSMQPPPHWDSWGTPGRAVGLPIPLRRPPPQGSRGVRGSVCGAQSQVGRGRGPGAAWSRGEDQRRTEGPQGMHLRPSDSPGSPPACCPDATCTEPPGRGRGGPGAGRPGPGRQREGAQPHQESRYNHEGDSEAARHPGRPCCQP